MYFLHIFFAVRHLRKPEYVQPPDPNQGPKIGVVQLAAAALVAVCLGYWHWGNKQHDSSRHGEGSTILAQAKTYDKQTDSSKDTRQPAPTPEGTTEALKAPAVVVDTVNSKHHMPGVAVDTVHIEDDMPAPRSAGLQLLWPLLLFLVLVDILSSWTDEEEDESMY